MEISSKLPDDYMIFEQQSQEKPYIKWYEIIKIKLIPFISRHIENFLLCDFKSRCKNKEKNRQTTPTAFKRLLILCTYFKTEL